MERGWGGDVYSGSLRFVSQMITISGLPCGRIRALLIPFTYTLMEVQSIMIIVLLLVCGSDYDSVTADQGKDIDPCGVCS